MSEAAAASPIRTQQSQMPKGARCMHEGRGGAATLPCFLVAADVDMLQLKGEWLRVPMPASTSGAACPDHPEGCSSDGFLFLGSLYAQSLGELRVRRVQEGHMTNVAAGLPGRSCT